MKLFFSDGLKTQPQRRCSFHSKSSKMTRVHLWYCSRHGLLIIFESLPEFNSIVRFLRHLCLLRKTIKRIKVTFKNCVYVCRLIYQECNIPYPHNYRCKDFLKFKYQDNIITIVYKNIYLFVCCQI